VFETAATIATPTSITQPAMFVPRFPLLILSLLCAEDHQSDGLGLRRSLPLTYVAQSATRFGNIVRCSLSTPRRYPCPPYYAAHRMALVSYLPSSVFHVLCSRWSMLSTVGAHHGPSIPCHALYALCSTVFTLYSLLQSCVVLQKSKECIKERVKSREALSSLPFSPTPIHCIRWFFQYAPHVLMMLLSCSSQTLYTVHCVVLLEDIAQLSEPFLTSHGTRIARTTKPGVLRIRDIPEVVW
jgi:hypothetical protein